MALFLKQTDQRSELQSRVDQELREKLHARQSIDMEEVEPSLQQDQSPTKGIGFVIIILVLVLIIGLAVWLASTA